MNITFSTYLHGEKGDAIEAFCNAMKEAGEEDKLEKFNAAIRYLNYEIKIRYSLNTETGMMKMVSVDDVVIEGKEFSVNK